MSKRYNGEKIVLEKNCERLQLLREKAQTNKKLVKLLIYIYIHTSILTKSNSNLFD